MFNLASIHFYEKEWLNLDKSMELLIKSIKKKIMIPFFQLLCLVIIKKLKIISVENIEIEFQKYDKEPRKFSERMFLMIKKMKLEDKAIQNKLYSSVKELNLVYYYERIENQSKKEFKERKKYPYQKDINELFYEGFR
ncbi:hypothetical protein M9Y10_015815 [Tritrichomonas musculus]|uniref:Uncharacterized protein n=1 Tax=Tritrichomonas musculus TaxID=1915356 RepID=A0ABR2I699_9EUKA